NRGICHRQNRLRSSVSLPITVSNCFVMELFHFFSAPVSLPFGGADTLRESSSVLCMAAGFSIEQKPATKFRLQKGVGKMPNATAGETRALLVKPTHYLLFTRLGML